MAGAIADIERMVALAVRSRWARFRKLLLHLSVAGGLAAAATLLVPRVPVPDRFDPTFFELLWFDGIWRQWSGYMLLGFSGAGLVAALLMKTRTVVRSGGSIWWRLAHVGFGVCCVLLLFGHTGFRLGVNVNAALMGCYVAVLVFGALAGMSTYGAAGLRKMGMTPQAARHSDEAARHRTLSPAGSPDHPHPGRLSVLTRPARGLETQSGVREVQVTRKQETECKMRK